MSIEQMLEELLDSKHADIGMHRYEFPQWRVAIWPYWTPDPDWLVFTADTLQGALQQALDVKREAQQAAELPH